MDPAPKFKRGDIVQLLSGGPAMTVCGYTGTYTVSVVWASSHGYHRETISEDLLKEHGSPCP